jgi:hypothetical protein
MGLNDRLLRRTVGVLPSRSSEAWPSRSRRVLERLVSNLPSVENEPLNGCEATTRQSNSNHVVEHLNDHCRRRHRQPVLVLCLKRKPRRVCARKPPSQEESPTSAHYVRGTSLSRRDRQHLRQANAASSLEVRRDAASGVRVENGRGLRGTLRDQSLAQGTRTRPHKEAGGNPN